MIIDLLEEKEVIEGLDKKIEIIQLKTPIKLIDRRFLIKKKYIY